MAALSFPKDGPPASRPSRTSSGDTEPLLRLLWLRPGAGQTVADGGLCVRGLPRLTPNPAEASGGPPASQSTSSWHAPLKLACTPRPGPEHLLPAPPPSGGPHPGCSRRRPAGSAGLASWHLPGSWGCPAGWGRCTVPSPAEGELGDLGRHGRSRGRETEAQPPAPTLPYSPAARTLPATRTRVSWAGGQG